MADLNTDAGTIDGELSTGGPFRWSAANSEWESVAGVTSGAIPVPAGATAALDGSSELLHEVSVDQDVAVSLNNFTAGKSIAADFINSTGTDRTVTLVAAFGTAPFVVSAGRRKCIRGSQGTNSMVATVVVAGDFDA